MIRWFERVTMTVIIINCITLGSYQPCQDASYCDHKCQILKVFINIGIILTNMLIFLQIIDDVIFAYFAAEMIIKMIALGVFGRGCYLSESWNKLDCFIVLTGLLDYFEYSGGAVNLTAIRTVRVLRPLRAINRIPSKCFIWERL